VVIIFPAGLSSLYGSSLITHEKKSGLQETDFIMARSGSGWGCDEDGADFGDAVADYSKQEAASNFTRKMCNTTFWTGDGLHQFGPVKYLTTEIDSAKMVETINTVIIGDGRVQLDTKTTSNTSNTVPEPEPEFLENHKPALSMTEAQKCGEDATEPYDCPILWNEKADCCAVLGGARPLPVKYGRSLAPGASPLITVQ
jgi:hypothetical protein